MIECRKQKNTDLSALLNTHGTAIHTYIYTIENTTDPLRKDITVIARQGRGFQNHYRNDEVR